MISGVGGLCVSLEDLAVDHPPLTLVSGGARSGKSAVAEKLVLARGLDPVYLATAPLDYAAADPEMAARIAAHKASRADHGWTTVEAGRALPDALRREANDPGRAILVDCLVVWLGTVMMDAFDAADGDEAARARVAGSVESDAIATLTSALDDATAPIVLVSGEVGMGVVPPTPLGRVFQDALGRLNQRLASRADRVVLCVAGLPLLLKNAVAGGSGKGEL